MAVNQRSYHDGLEPHEADYKPLSMEEYSNEELRQWVHLLRKRAGHRTNEEKRAKDLYDADNYERVLRQREQPNTR